MEELHPFKMEAMYNTLGVSMDYPEELWRRMAEKHGVQPFSGVGTGRRGF